MKCVSALSTAKDTEDALKEVLEAATGVTEEVSPADLVLVFASRHHADGLGRIAAEVRRRGLGRHVLGCTGESIVGEDREVEGAPALSLWSIGLPGARLEPLRLAFGDGQFAGWPEWATGPNPPPLILLGDPFSFPTDDFLKRLHDESPGTRVVGGMASGSHSPGGNRLVLDDRVFEDGAVAVRVDGPLTIRTVVSQGCRPIGRPMIVTKADGNLIREVGRRPALEVLRELFEILPPDDQRRVQEGLHVGRVINEYQDTFGRGDFLVRNVIGSDEGGAIAITESVRVGQTVQFHVRDADSADEDLRTLLENEHRGRPGAGVGGALLFSCNGRGSRLFPGPNHDVATIREILGPIPVAGFFAMGEIGPIGGQNFVHGYTASIVLFEEV